MECFHKGLYTDKEDMSPIAKVEATLQEQLALRFELDSLDADALPVTASLLDARFKNVKFFCG